MFDALAGYARAAKETVLNHLNDHEKGRSLGLMICTSGAAISVLFLHDRRSFSELPYSQMIVKTISWSIFVLGVGIWARAAAMPPNFLREARMRNHQD